VLCARCDVRGAVGQRLLHARHAMGMWSPCDFSCSSACRLMHRAINAGKQLLHSAAANGHAQMVRALVELGASVEWQSGHGNRPLHAATYGCATAERTETVRTLLELGADVHAVNSRGENPLHGVRNTAAVRLLLEAGANLNHRNLAGATPLVLAVQNAEIPVIKALVQAGARPYASD
jgi:ankyrin repeat protein